MNFFFRSFTRCYMGDILNNRLFSILCAVIFLLYFIIYLIYLIVATIVFDLYILLTTKIIYIKTTTDHDK